MKDFARALAFAAKKHAGQKRKNGDNYIIHPIRVSQEVFTEKQKVIALLHDTLEDTDTTYAELKIEFGTEIAHTVLVLTREKDETYEDYIHRVKTNPDAIAVKIADISDNLDDAPSDQAIKRSAAAITELLS
jgi:guanosine-3',5'-bis(diphosphate) 3'-pyrophosphohydrolase